VHSLRGLSVLLPLLTAPIAAQDSAESLRLRGVTLDHWGPGVGTALLRPTYRATKLTRGRVGSDFALVMFPDGISLRPLFIAAGLQAGLAYRLVVAGPGSLLLKGGGAGIAAVGAGAPPRVVPGVHVGLGLLVPLDARSLIRADLTRHLYTTNGRTMGIWSFGIGFAAARKKP
jgi:hypothetical protein